MPNFWPPSDPINSCKAVAVFVAGWEWSNDVHMNMRKPTRWGVEVSKRSGIVSRHFGNARPHTSLATRQKLRELGWKRTAKVFEQNGTYIL
ncbi:unnamed protein product [Pieris macdunnoughi]|uniref:Uncharacterized protein n=1 Tax=Pieris macdunnoughi TaxID=345717 RepID=A0A821XPT2_9NEOP|nr:unnamed protein product [Pieris macdunnoughi]